MAKEGEMTAALEGTRVLDLTRLLPGGYCTMLLADLGAEVIKVEEPEQGDYARHARPPFIGGVGSLFLLLNRNKKSMILNLKAEAGREVFRHMVKGADALVESFRPGVMERLGVGYASLRELNPRLVYCAITGFGQDGPYRDVVGHDLNYAAIAGLTGVTGPRNGAPVVPGVQVGDLGGGALLPAFGILAALMAREKTGRGQFIDAAMTDGVVSLMAVAAAYYFATGVSPGCGTMALNGGAPYYNVYQTKDGGYITIGNNEPKFWANFCQIMGQEDLIAQQEATGGEREKVFAAVQEAFLTKTRDEWFAILKDKDVCVGPVYKMEEVFTDPQIRHRGLLQEMDHPVAGRIRQVAHPLKFSETPASIRTPAPQFGEHTVELLAQVGYTPAQIEELRRVGAIK